MCVKIESLKKHLKQKFQEQMKVPLVTHYIIDYIISRERLTADLCMIAVDFAGPVGLGVSTLYFILMQPMEHQPTPSYTE